MRRKGLSPMQSDHINVTPLIDVMMCLIIFFLLCGQFAKSESNDKVRIPEAAQGQEMGDQRGRLLINVVPVGDGKDRALIVIREKQVDPDSLTKYLVNERLDNPDVKVIIRADEDLPYSLISPVLVACSQANIQSVNFATRKP